jgi:hypothetical protein
MRNMSLHIAKAEHEAAYQDLVALINRHPGLSAIELLAVAANMVGKLMAMQDQRKLTVDEVKELVAKNIEGGNQQVIAVLAGQQAGRA